MKILIVLTCLVLAINATSDADLWAEFKEIHTKEYRNLIEEKRRFAIFQSNLRTIEKHNERYDNGEETYYLKVTEFADLTDEEFKAIYLKYEKPDFKYTNSFVLKQGVPVPDAIDWREKGAVLGVKTQGDCGSCWAFSSVGALEGQNAIKNNITLGLSAEELVECSTVNHGCNGGNMMNSFLYVIKNGISTEESYPYSSEKGVVKKCRIGENSKIKVVGYANVSYNEESLKEAVGTVGPISVAINGYGIRLYGGGIFVDPNCTKSLSHAVLAVGYGTEGDLDYWIIKNSWGPKWGENGYLKTARNRNQQCGISLDNSYPILQ